MAKLTKPVIKPVTPADITAGSITIKWDMDPGATSYTVNIFKGSVSANNKITGYPQTATGPDSHTISGLPGSTKYIFRIQAVSATPADTSDFSDDVEATTKAAALPKHGIPTNLHKTGEDAQAKKVTVDWTVPATAGTGTLYDFTEKADGSGVWDNQGHKPYTLTNVPNTEVTLRIRTKADATHQASDWSAPIKFTLSKPKLAAPVLSLGTITDTSLTATWSAVPNATSYKIKVNGKAYVTATSPKVITGLTQSSLQTIKVKAVANNFTDSDDSTKTATTLATPATSMVITIPGGDSQSVVQGSSFTIPTATVSGGTTPTVTANPSSIVTTGTVGSKVQITYTAHDTGTPAAPDVTRVLTITITAPAKVYNIHLTGQANQQYEAVRGTFGHEVDKAGNPITNNIYKEQGAQIVDSGNVVDTGLSTKIKETWVPGFNPNKPGDYVASYTLLAADNPNNKDIKVTRTVKIVDTTKPIVELIDSNVINVAKGFDINTIFPADGTSVKVSDNAEGAPIISKTDTTVGNSVTREYKVTDAQGNFSVVTRTINILDDLNVTIPDIHRNTHSQGAITPSPVTSNALGNVTYTYNPDISTIATGVVKDTTVTVTATEPLKYGTRTGSATFVVSVAKFTPDLSNENWLDGKVIFESNYSSKEGDGKTPNTDSKIETQGTQYEKSVKLAKTKETPIDIKAPGISSVWFDEEAMDPYERRIVADEVKKPY